MAATGNKRAGNGLEQSLQLTSHHDGLAYYRHRHDDQLNQVLILPEILKSHLWAGS